MKNLLCTLTIASLCFACSDTLDPEDVEDAEPSDVLLSGAAGSLGLFGGAAAAIAIPNFIAMQYRSKRSEVQANLKAIKTTQMAYDAEFTRYLSVRSYQPDSDPGKTLRDFPAGTAFDTLGWMPDGQVRGSYKVQTLSSTDFMVYAITDVDGDGNKSSWTCTKTINVTMNTANDVY